MKLSMIWYEIEYFSFLIIAVLFSAGNAKKNVFTVFIDPIVTIGVLLSESQLITNRLLYYHNRNVSKLPPYLYHIVAFSI